MSEKIVGDLGMKRLLSKKIAVLPGDGIGIEVTHEAIKVFELLNVPVELCFGDIGWEFWKSEGNPIPKRTWDLILKSDVTLLGAITSMPKRESLKALPNELKDQSIEYVSPIIQLRQRLDLYVNIRPCFNVSGSIKEFDFAVIRENTEGLYAGFDYYPVPKALHQLLDKSIKWSKYNYDELSVSLRLQSKIGLLRLFEYAFSYAQKNQLSRVTFADKPNVLRHSSAFARECFEAIASQHSHIQADILNVDAVALWLVRRPEEFGVIVAENMFGDILSDLGAGVMGGLGFAPSANIGEKGAYFEPVHGSAPRVAAGSSNPSAMFLTCAMLLDYIGYSNEAVRIRKAIKQVVKVGRHLTYDIGGKASTVEMSKAILDAIDAPRKHKTIAFLATGSEFLSGELLESNAHNSAKLIQNVGGEVSSIAIASDKQQDITLQLNHLLTHNDAVITIGGLGPTSDDNTRFAIADVIRQPLELDNSSRKHVEERLSRFGLKVTASNLRQALFPHHAKILHNAFGTANACHLQWRDRDIFMLPGPPKEYFPLFEHYVMSYLKSEDYCHLKKIYNYMTLGLIEGEISEQVDSIARKYQFASAYRWHYPYLNIKLMADDNDCNTRAIQEIVTLLDGHIVSSDGSTAEELLLKRLTLVSKSVVICTSVETQALLASKTYPHVVFVQDDTQILSDYMGYFNFELIWPSSKDLQTKSIVEFMVSGLNINNELIYTCQLRTPMRENDIDICIHSYFAWQLFKFINTIDFENILSHGLWANQ